MCPLKIMLQNFMLERLMERISISKYKDMLILKGGMLIATLVGINSRTTMDMVRPCAGIPCQKKQFKKLCWIFAPFS